MTKKTHACDSKVQRDLEPELVAQLGEYLGILLRPRELSIAGCRMHLDGHFEDEKRIVVAEAFSRIGALASGQRRKIMSDILKLAFLDTVTDKKVEKYLVFADGSSVGFLQGKAWAAKALNTFDIKIHVVVLCKETVERLLLARKRQKKGMASASKAQ